MECIKTERDDFKISFYLHYSFIYSTGEEASGKVNLHDLFQSFPLCHCLLAPYLPAESSECKIIFTQIIVKVKNTRPMQFYEKKEKKIYAICLATLEFSFNVLDSGSLIDDFLTVTFIWIWIVAGSCYRMVQSSILEVIIFSRFRLRLNFNIQDI